VPTEPTSPAPSIEHPPWCNSAGCTAPSSQPTELDPDWPDIAHRSAPISLAWSDATQAYLYQYVAPWTCETYLHIAVEKGQLLAVPVAAAAEVLAGLVDLIRPAITHTHRSYPRLPIPGASLFADLVADARMAAAAARCGAELGVWTAVHHAAAYAPDGKPTRIRVAPHDGEPVVGYVVRLNDRGFELADGNARFDWGAVATVTPIDVNEVTAR
jgi:hypothetical protein